MIYILNFLLAVLIMLFTFGAVTAFTYFMFEWLGKGNIENDEDIKKP